MRNKFFLVAVNASLTNHHRKLYQLGLYEYHFLFNVFLFPLKLLTAIGEIWYRQLIRFQGRVSSANRLYKEIVLHIHTRDGSISSWQRPFHLLYIHTLRSCNYRSCRIFFLITMLDWFSCYLAVACIGFP